MSKKTSWSVEQLGRTVHRLSVDLSRKQSAYLLLRSDAHFDSNHHDPAHSLELKHLKEAKARGAAIIDNGDAMDLMQGRDDHRSSKSDIRPCDLGGNYFDKVIADYAKFLKPYAHNLKIFGTGNHESSVLRKFEWSPTTRLVERLRALTGATIHEAGYTSWIIVQVRRPTGGNAKPRPTSSNIKIWRTHGSTTGGGINQGTPAAAKLWQSAIDADCVIQGHNHREWIMTQARMRITNRGRVYQDTQFAINLPSYKDEFGDGYSGIESSNWTVEKGMPPKPTGAMWMRIYWEGERLAFALERAQ